MAIISIRLKEEEEKMLEYLKEFYNRDKSSLIREILQEKYEDLQDMKVISNFETREGEQKASFSSFDEIVGKG
jgi:predicted DNA-binding protein